MYTLFKCGDKFILCRESDGFPDSWFDAGVRVEASGLSKMEADYIRKFYNLLSKEDFQHSLDDDFPCKETVKIKESKWDALDDRRSEIY